MSGRTDRERRWATDIHVQAGGPRTSRRWIEASVAFTDFRKEAENHMHKRMTRFLSAFSLLAVLPAAASASPARVHGLNVPVDYIKDYTGIYTFVSGIGSVGNLVYVEPTAGNESMGAVLGNLMDGRMGTWGIHMRRFHAGLGQATSIESPMTSFAGFSDPNTNGEALDLMWGHKMGNGSLGLRLNRSFISNEVTAGTAEGNGTLGRNIWGIGAGFGFQMNENTDVELAGHFQNRSFKGTNLGTPDAAGDDGGTTYLVAGRAMMKSSGNLVWMPLLKAYSFDLSSLDASTPAVRTDQKFSGWEAGIAGNWSIASDDLLVVGLQFVGNKFEQTIGTGPKTELNETFYPNAFMALEAHVNSWLTLRFGAQNSVLYSVKQEAGTPVVTQTIKVHTFTFDMGAGVKVGSLMLDATLTPNFWNNPVSAVWNNGLGGAPFPRVSATYSF